MPPGALQVAYRCLTLTEQQKAKYVAHPNDRSMDYFSFDGFTSASTSPTKAVDILQEWKCNSMFIIGQGSDGQCEPWEVGLWHSLFLEPTPQRCCGLTQMFQAPAVFPLPHWSEATCSMCSTGAGSGTNVLHLRNPHPFQVGLKGCRYRCQQPFAHQVGWEAAIVPWHYPEG